MVGKFNCLKVQFRPHVPHSKKYEIVFRKSLIGTYADFIEGKKLDVKFWNLIGKSTNLVGKITNLIKKIMNLSEKSKRPEQ